MQINATSRRGRGRLAVSVAGGLLGLIAGMALIRAL